MHIYILFWGEHVQCLFFVLCVLCVRLSLSGCVLCVVYVGPSLPTGHVWVLGEGTWLHSRGDCKDCAAHNSHSSSILSYQSFYSYHSAGQTTLDSSYVSGLSVNYGITRNHIWTFAVGVSKDYNHACCICSCAAPYPGPAVPPFVGENYVCESGNTGYNKISGT